MLSSEQAQVGLRARNRRDKLERIERAARELFARDGFDATTTREIAERAGIGAGTLFLYFPEKRDLLIHLFERDVAPVQRRAFASIEGLALPLREALERVFRTFYRHYGRDVRLSRVYLKEILFLDGAQRASMSAFTVGFLRDIAGLFEDARVRGEVRPAVQPLEAAYGAFSLYCLTLLNWLGGVIPTRRAAEARLGAGLGLLLEGVLEPASAAARSADREATDAAAGRRRARSAMR